MFKENGRSNSLKIFTRQNKVIDYFVIDVMINLKKFRMLET